MNSLFDLLLYKPISDIVLNGLLFMVFTFHLFFVLMMLGTAILAFYFFIETWWGGKIKELRWDKEILRSFLAHKSLAVVLGVGALLLIQVGYTIPFFTGVTLFAPYWMWIIVLLVIAFLLFDALAHRIYVHHYLHLIFGIIALGAILAVPAIFVMVLVTAENSTHWVSIIQEGHKLTGGLAVHWLFRYLHILGAAVVFGAVFHYFFSSKQEPEKRKKLILWMIGGLLYQFILGVLLYGSVPHKIDTITIIFMMGGVLAAVTMLWVIFYSLNKNKMISGRLGMFLALLILVPMLITRQFIQDKVFYPLAENLKKKSATYEKILSPYAEPAIQKYRNNFNVVYNNGETIFQKSCAFCHGKQAEGNGPEAVNLKIPPEAISQIRTTRDDLYRILVNGVPGTGMPYFSYYDKGKIDDLMNYLNRTFEILGKLPSLPVKVSSTERDSAQIIFDETCINCHGKDGKGSAFGKALKPSPPDFTRYNPLPKKAFHVIENGYPGTMLPAFPDIPVNTRWALVSIVNSKFRK